MFPGSFQLRRLLVRSVPTSIGVVRSEVRRVLRPNPPAPLEAFLRARYDNRNETVRTSSLLCAAASTKLNTLKERACMT